MKKIPEIKMVMTPFPYTIDIEASLSDANDMMERHGFHHLPVTRDDELVGVLTDRDLKKVFDPNANPPFPSSLKVYSVCVLQIYCVELTEPLDTVAEYMADHHIGSALVLKQGQLVGIFTTSDACRYLAKFLRQEYLSDDVITLA